MRRRTALILLPVLLLGILVVGAAFLLTRDLGAYRHEITSRLSAATGREISITGDLKLDLGLAPALVASGVRIANAPGGSRPDMVTIGRLEAVVPLLPLLTGEIRIQRLVIADADLLLERDQAGRGNWELGVADGNGAGGTESDGGLPALGKVVLRRSVLTYRDKGESYRINIDEISIVEKDVGGPLQVTGALSFDGMPVEMAGAVEAMPARITLRDLRLAAAGSDLAGELALSLDGERPHLAGTLTSARLDLNALRPAPSPAAGPGAADDRLFSDAPLPRDALSVADAELAFTGAEVAVGPFELRDVDLTLRLADGRLDLKPASATLAAGHLDIQAVVEARRSALAVDAEARLTKADFGLLMRRTAESELFAGTLDASFALRGRGGSLHTLAASATGSAQLVITEGSIASRYLDFLAADLVGLLLPGGTGDRTEIRCLIADYGIEQGLAKSRMLMLDTERMVLLGEGTIDLGRERIDHYLRPRPKDPSLLSLATPIVVSGPLRSPRAVPDHVALGKDAAIAVLGNVLLPGAGLLLPFLDTGAGEDHPCLVAVKDQEAAAQPRQPGPGGVPGMIEEIGKGIGEGIGSIFGGGQ